MSDICETCGGAKTFNQWVDINHVDVHGSKPTMPAVTMVKICVCPRFKEKHDGKLEGRNPYTVQHMFGLLRPSIASIKIGHDEVSDDEVWLLPKQALSLLNWLTQERDTLEQLAKEQE